MANASEGNCSFRIKNRNFAKNALKNIDCGVCNELFNADGEKVPRLLHCGHTVCQSCLLRLPHRDNIIYCPFDRQSTSTCNLGVIGLKKNFALLELLECIQPTNSPSTSSAFSSLFRKVEEKPVVCCDENESHLAAVYCTTCDTNLCDECSEAIHSSKTLSKHKRVPLIDKPKDRIKCPQHPSHVAEFTCLEEECKNRWSLMCCICKYHGRHKTHQHSLVEDEADVIKTTVSAALAGISVFMESVQETSHRIEQVIQQMEGTDTQTGTGLIAQARVHFHFDKLREALTQQEQMARGVVDSFLRDRLASLRLTKDHLATAMTQVESTCVQVSTVMQQEDARIVLASRELEEALASVQTTLAQFAQLGGRNLQPDPCIPITFTKDNKVHIGPKIEMRVVTLGLNGAGKTSILFKLKQNEFMAMIPTIGFNVETIEYKNLKFTIWDVGGQPKLRPLWKHYYLNTQAVVFVVDSTTPERLPEVHTELVKLLAEKELADAALLILANKQDVEGGMSLDTIADGLSLNKLCGGRSWHMEACSAQNGQGLVEALDWLARQLLASGAILESE